MARTLGGHRGSGDGLVGGLLGASRAALAEPVGHRRVEFLRILEQCPSTTVVTIAGAGHFTLNQEPARVAELLVEALGATDRP